MPDSKAQTARYQLESSVGLLRYGIGLTALWTVALAASLWWFLHVQRQDEQAAAAITARISYEADVKYLSWLSALGGLYVNTSEPFPPDPHLGGLPERQIQLADGSTLMPLTPIYVLRLVHALDVVPLEVSSHLRSLTPVVPEDVPDPWEKKALGELTRGRRELAEIGEIEGETYLRFMRPLRLGRDCITCHSKEGYEEGTLQGGISVTVPMDRPEEFGRRSDVYVYGTHGMLWLLGVGFIGYGTRKLAARIRERDQALEAVSAERNFSDSVLQTVGALVVVLDAQGRIVRFNRACEQVTGYSFAEVRGIPVWHRLLRSEDRDSFRQKFERLRTDLAPISHETPWVGRDGRSRIIAWSDTPLLNAKGTVEHIIATGIDVTEKRQTEAALKESEERYRGLVESSPDAVFVQTGSRVVFCNAAGAKLLGVEGPDRLLGRPFLDFVHSDCRESMMGRIQGIRGGSLPAPMSEEKLVGLSGGLVETEVAAIPFRYQGQDAVQVIARDIGARRRAEQALRDSEARYRTLVENVELGITLIGSDYRVVMSNAAQGRLIGKNTAEFQGRECFREFEQRDNVCTHCPGARAMKTGRPASVETIRAKAGGSSVPVRIQAFPILAPDGGTSAFIEVTEDVTLVKRAEEERIKLEQKILQTQKLESLGVLAGGIAHDFNNLLMGVLGNVDLAVAKSPQDSPCRPYLKRIEGAAQRAADLTSQMLAYSGKGKFVVERIHLSRLVEELGHLLDTVVSKKAVLRYALAPALPMIQGDATQLRQVVMNLITNASDAIGEHPGTITVSTGVIGADRAYLAEADLGDALTEGRYAYVEVSDTGCGMDADTMGKVFEPFFTTKQTGRGLGLAAVLGIVRGHKGGLKLRSRPDRGTTFRVFFPVVDDSGEENPGNEAQPGGADRRTECRGRVLVVDDDETVLSIAKDMLEDHGFTVLSASDGVEGVEVFREHQERVSAIVLDMTMPRMNGAEALQEIRKLRPEVPVVLCSGYNEQEAAEHFGDRRFSRFVHKPYRSMDLIAALEALIEVGPASVRQEDSK